MKRMVALFGLIFLLSGCAQTELEQGMELRGKLLQAETCSFDANVTADYGDRLCQFSMNCSADKEGAVTFTVTKPENIAGISGKLDKSGGSITFDDTVLEFGLMAEDRLSPVSAPWVLIKTLRGGYLKSAGRSDGVTRLSLDDSYQEDALTVDVWLGEDGLPTRGEILFNGRRILTVEVEKMQIL